MAQGTAQKGVQPVSDNGGSLTVDGTVELGAASLAALESITVVDGGGSLTVDGSVSVSNFPATQPVSGTVAVTGPLTDTQLRASAVPVSGTFFQATQPVSIAATLPVSGPLTDAQLRASAVPVSGPLTDTQIRATPLPVSGSVTVSDGSGLLSVDDGAGSLTVDSTQLPAALAAGGGLKIEGVAGGVAVPVSDGAGSLTVDAPVGTPAFVRLSDGAAAITTLPVSLATNTPDVTDRAARLLGVVASVSSPVVSKIQDSAGNATETTTKGTSGTRGLLAQDFKDTGRNARIFMLDAITAAPVAEAMQSVVQWYGNAAVGATVSPAVVPAGKTLRLQTWKIQYQSLATVGYAVVRVRINTTGTAVLGSPLAFSFEAGTNSGATTTAVTGAVTTAVGEFPDGFELPAGAGVGFSMAGYGPTGALTLEGGVRFMVAGFEY